jgi:hypothetical protein
LRRRLLKWIFRKTLHLVELRDLSQHSDWYGRVPTKEREMKILLIAAALLLAAAPFGQDSMHTRKGMRVSMTTAKSIIGAWKAEPRKAADKMLAKYGEPNEATANRLIWWNNGPWKFTIIEDIEIPHAFPMPHKDLMRQGVDYKVPPSRVDDLAMYDGSVIFDRTPGELSARCDKEEANFLAINLANDVVTGKRSISNARAFYARTVKALMAMKPNAEQKRYTSGFTFRVPMGNTGFKDKPHGM